MDNKIALVTVAKLEELYITEWVEHYIKLGFDKIIIGDNNDLNYIPKLFNVLAKYIKTGIVDIVEIPTNYNINIPIQSGFNDNTYKKIYNDYDWVAFFDTDEFLVFKEELYKNNIKLFLNLSKFKPFTSICFNSKWFGDNNMMYNNGCPVLERFDYEENSKYTNIVKSIVRGHMDIIIGSLHDPKGDEYGIHGIINDFSPDSNKVFRCDVFGIPRLASKTCKAMIDVFGRYYLDKCYSIAELKHFDTKTIDEYFYNKMCRGRVDRLPDTIDNYRYNWLFFFRHNKLTDLKKKYVLEHNNEFINWFNTYKNKYNK